MKKFYAQHYVGTSTYNVIFHNGIKKHKDGSDFFDIRTFKNKVKLNSFVKKLIEDGYAER